MTSTPVATQPTKRFAYITLVVIGAAITLPSYWVVVTAIREGSEVLPTSTKSLIPTALSLESARYVLDNTRFLVYLRNSAVVAIASTMVVVILGSMAGYSLARFKYRGRMLIGRLVLFAYVVPPVLLLVPVFFLVRALGLFDNLAGLVLAHITFALPFSIWLLRGYFMTLPVELEEAALVDGCGRLGALWRVVLPLSAPALAATATFAFILSWQEYTYALVFLPSTSVQTLPVGVTSSLITNDMTAEGWGRLMAASTMALLPILAAFLVFQRWLMGGLLSGSVKG